MNMFKVKYDGNRLGVLEYFDYFQTSDLSHTLVGNKIVDHSDVVGASPVDAASTISLFST